MDHRLIWIYMLYEVEKCTRWAVVCLGLHFLFILTHTDLEDMTLILIFLGLFASVLEDVTRKPFKISWIALLFQGLTLSLLTLTAYLVGRWMHPYLDPTDWRKNPRAFQGLTAWSVLHFVDFYFSLAFLRGVMVLVVVGIRLIFIASRYIAPTVVGRFF